MPPDPTDVLRETASSWLLGEATDGDLKRTADRALRLLWDAWEPPPDVVKGSDRELRLALVSPHPDLQVVRYMTPNFVLDPYEKARASGGDPNTDLPSSPGHQVPFGGEAANAVVNRSFTPAARLALGVTGGLPGLLKEVKETLARNRDRLLSAHPEVRLRRVRVTEPRCAWDLSGPLQVGVAVYVHAYHLPED